MPARYNKTKKWWATDATVTLPNGDVRRIRKKSPVQTKRGANQYEQQLVKQVLASYASGKSAPAPRFEAFARDYLRTYVAANNRVSTARSVEIMCRLHLLKAFGPLPLDAITAEKIELYKAQKLALLSAQTVRNHLSTLRTILRIAVEWGKLDKAPKFRMPEVPAAAFDFFSEDEVRRLVAAANPRDYALILVAVRTGLRCGELRGLQWGDVQERAGNLVVRHNLVLGRMQAPKGKRERTIPLGPAVLAALKALPRKGPFVFQLEGKPRTRMLIDWSIYSACRKAGLRRVGPHVLRHTFASHLVAKGVPLKVVQELLGHSSITTTERYAHLAPGATAAAIALLESPVPSSGNPQATTPRRKG